MKLDLRFIIPGPNRTSVLLDPDGRLPASPVDGDQDEATVVAATACLRGVFGFAAPILETHPRWKGVPEGDPIPVLVMTEPAALGWTPPAGLAFGAVPPVAPDLPDLLSPRAAELLDELRTGAQPPALRPRWSRPGWQARASGWMIAAAAAARRPLVEEPAPFYLRGISALLHGRTAGRDLFLKAVFPPFHAEPAITRLLAERFPGSVPVVVAVEPDEGWLLVEDVAAPLIGEKPAADRRLGLDAGARALVALQRAAARDVRPFAEAGCPRRHLAELPDALAGALGPEAVVVDASWSPQRRAGIVDVTRAAAERVARLGFPTTVVHGDFHPGNVTLAGGRATIIDWSDTAISDPSIDLVTWLSWSRDRPDDERVATDAWIDAWSADTDPATVRAAIDAILVVGAAYQVVSYDGILRGLEPATRYTMADGARSFLEKVERARSDH